MTASLSEPRVCSVDLEFSGGGLRGSRGAAEWGLPMRSGEHTGEEQFPSAFISDFYL